MTASTGAGSYLDTSVAVAAIVPAVPHHRACAAFCQTVEESRTKVVISAVLRVEFAQSWFRMPQLGYVDPEIRRSARLGAWDRDVAVRERWMRLGIVRLDTWLARFREVLEVPLTLATWRASVDLMARHRLRSLDAVHVATALNADVAGFASVDGDFRRVPNLRLRLLRDAPT